MSHKTDLCLLHAGIDAVKAKYSEVPKLSVHFAADASGLLQLTKGEAVIETTEEYTVKVRAGIAPSTNGCTLGALCCMCCLDPTHVLESTAGRTSAQQEACLCYTAGAQSKDQS